MKKGLLFDRVGSQGGNGAVDQRHKGSSAVLAAAAPPQSAWDQEAPALANVTVDLGARFLCLQRLAHEAHCYFATPHLRASTLSLGGSALVGFHSRSFQLPPSLPEVTIDSISFRQH